MALRLGRADVHQLCKELTAKQLLGWEHYAAIEPFNFFTELRADYRAASIVQMLHNVNAKKALGLKEFLLKFEEAAERKPQSPAEQERIMRIMMGVIPKDA